MWGLFFFKFRDVRGWQFKELSLLMAIGSGGYGLMQIAMGGLKDLSRIILDGDLDLFLTKPQPVLLHVAGSKSFAKGWGQLLTTLILIIFSGPFTIMEYFIILFSIITSCMIFSSIQIIAASFVFWLGPVESVVQRYSDSLFLFALYPSHIYSGWLQVVMFTIIPAGIIGYLPIDLITHFSWSKFAILFFSAALFLTVAFSIFYCGIKKYTSSNSLR